MNLHALPAIDEATAIPPADDAVARALDAAKLSDESALLGALEARRTQMALSFKALDLAAHLAAGHASKVMSAARAKTPTTKTLFALLDALHLSIVLVHDPSKANGATWPRRDASKARMSGAISPIAIGRARPHVVAELLAKASRPKWKGMLAPAFLKMVKEDGQ